MIIVSQNGKSIINFKNICKIDVNHIFFQHFGKPTDAITAILKTIAIAKFTAKEQGNDTAGELLTYFNQYIKETKV